MAEPTDKETRGPVNLRIKFRSESLQQFIERYGVDVSRGGIFIRTREPLPVGTRLKLDFQLVDTAPLFQGDGTVVWIREHDPARAGVTPGMGVRFDRLSTESQTTLDTILEEKIRLQQSGVAPGSIAKAGAGMAVRRPSGAFATLESQAARPAAPPLPLPVQVNLDKPEVPATSSPQPTSGPMGAPSPPSAGAAPVAAMPVSATRSGQHATGPSSIFTRPRTTSGGLRTVPVPSALFEAPTAADIDKALSVLEEKGGPAPSLPIAQAVIKPETSQALGEDEPTKVFDSAAQQEFSQTEAVTGPAHALPDEGVPIDAGDVIAEGDLTQRREVDPEDGQLKHGHARANGGASKVDGLAATMLGMVGTSPPPPPAGAKPPAPLDAPLASLVDSGSAPAAKPPAPPPPMKPAANTIPPTGAVTAKSGVPVRITTDRPAATESGRFRSDTRYKRRRSKAPYYVVALVLVAGGGGVVGFRYYKSERAKREAAAIAAAAAAPPFAAGQNVTPPPAPQPTTGPGGGAAVAPPDTTGPGPSPSNEANEKAAENAANTAKPEKTAKPEETAEKAEKAIAKVEAQPEKAGKAETGKPEKKSHRREKASGASAEAAKPAGEKPEEAAGEKRSGEEAKSGETAKAGETGKSAEKAAGDGAKPGEGEKSEKSGEAAKAAEAATPTLTERPVLKITSSPAGADVVIDGVPVGTTPFSSKDVTADGTHAISIKKDGYETFERMISGSDWARGKGGAQSLKFNAKLKRVGGEKPAAPADTGEKKPPDVEILTPSDP